MTGQDAFGLRRLWCPAGLYLLAFFLLNPHLVARFSSHFYFGGLDGFQNVWNIWWVDRSVRVLGRWPWWTEWLHHPYGTSLIGHTLNPFNGLVGIALLKGLTIVETYNTIVVFSFVMGGVTAFWLAGDATGSYVGSLVGGAVFTFSSFHFMHADGHLQLVSLEWLPLFVLAWMRFCEQPTPGRGIAASAALLLVLLCDVYYFAFGALAAAFFYVSSARRRRDALFLLRRDTLGSALAFLVPTAMTSGVFVTRLVWQNATDPLLGTHSPKALSSDLLSPFVWGYFWRFRDWVEPLWRPLSEYPHEASVYVGLTVWGLAIYGWRHRARHAAAHLGFWWWLILFFGVMSLGPNLHVAGWEVPGPTTTVMGHQDVNLLVLPYAVLWLVVPPWRLAGVPLRMMVMVQLSAAVLAAGGLRALMASTWPWRRVAVGACAVLLVVDFLPAPIETTLPDAPRYVGALARLPDGAVLDLVSPAPNALWYQTLHQKPMAFGYISRTPTSIDEADQALAGLILKGDWERIAREYHFRYLVAGGPVAYVMVRGLNGATLPPILGPKKLYDEDGVAIYEF